MLNQIYGNLVKSIANKKCYLEKSKLNKDQIFMNCCGNGDVKRKKFKSKKIKAKLLIIEDDFIFL